MSNILNFTFHIGKNITSARIALLMFALISCGQEKREHSHEAVPSAKSASAEHDVMLSDTQIRLANVTTRAITTQPIGETILVNGRLLVNEELSDVVSSRVQGRIERLYFKESGLSIQKGQPLYTLFSESLLTLQKELLLAKEQYESLGATEKRYKSFYDAARRKLMLYGMTEQQIQTLENSKQIKSAITFVSPASGVISELSITEGQYVAEGTQLMKIQDLTSLWLEADLFPGETRLARKGEKLTVKIAGDEHSSWEATIDFLSPEFRSNSQVTVMRASLNNPGLKMRPGMQAQVFFTHSAKKALTLPIDAVIRDGNGTHVYVQRGMNTFRPAPVKTGLEDFDNVEITEGINEGDTVVITGAYLLYSEIILKKGADPMTAHNH
jgi:membrane fusion protein, copper/silver efflux system